MKTRLLAIFFVLAALVQASCMMDAGEQGPGGSTKGVKFRITVPTGVQQQTRALTESDEYAVAEVAVLAFDATAKTLVGQYLGTITSPPVQISGSAAEMGFEATIPSGTYNLMIVANAAAITAMNSAVLIPGATQDDVETALSMTMTTAGWNATPGSPGYRNMPMWGYATDIELPAKDPIPTIYLTRMVARVDVVLGPDVVNTDKNFQLKTVRAYNYTTSGRLIPDTGGAFDWAAVTQTNLGDYDTPTIPTGATRADHATDWIERPVTDPLWQELTGEIYLFESHAGIDPEADLDAWLGNTCLVIGGCFSPDGGTTWNPETYYRIDFRQETDPDVFEYIPLLRNNAYTVNIFEVTGDGRKTPGEALENPSLASNIQTYILDWHNRNSSVTLGDGKEYILDLSAYDFEFDVIARTAADTDNTFAVITDAPSWTTSLWDDMAGTVALSDDAVTGQPWISLAIDGNVVHIVMDTNTSGATRTGYIHVTAGKSNCIVQVTQNTMIVSTLFARSNIVFVADESGGHLTFAETEADNDIIPANAQGLYFFSGSLTPVIPTPLPGSTASNYVPDNYPLGHVIFDPRPAGVYSYAWGATTGLSYIAQTTDPFDDSDKTEDDFAAYNGGKGFDESAAVGDICRYITARGWVKGKWRLPTAQELQFLADEKPAIRYGTWGSGSVIITQTGENPDYGQLYEYGFFQMAAGYMFGFAAAAGDDMEKPTSGIFFPASGYRSSGNLTRANATGSYWSGSSQNTASNYMMMSTSTAPLNMSQQRRNAETYSIRCIRDIK